MFAIRSPIVETQEFFEYRAANSSEIMVGIIPIGEILFSVTCYLNSALQLLCREKKMLFQSNSEPLVLGLHHAKVFFGPAAAFFSYDNVSIRIFRLI